MNRMSLATLALAHMLAAGPADATREYLLPTLFDVEGVAADDVLNVRAGPGTGHPVVGTLSPDDKRIEVVAHDRTGRWGQINLEEQSGWVAMRYLAYRTDVWQPGALPEGLRCIGTEPFWTLRPEEDALVFEAMGNDPVRMRLEAVLGTGIFRDPRRAMVADADGQRLMATLETKACSDQMSDLAYGLSVMVVREVDGAATLLAGCCRLAR